MRKMIPSLMLILLYGTAGANGGTFVMGAGGKPCGEILKEDRAARVYSIFWIQGYLSGINSYVRANSIDQTNLMVDYDTIDIWIENYCRTNPLDSLHNAAWSLGGALYARTRSADSDRNKQVVARGYTTPALISSNVGAVSVDLVCGHEYQAQNIFVISPFDNVDKVVRQASHLRIAIPMENGQFKVANFSLSGSAYALDQMRAAAEGAANTKKQGDPRTDVEYLQRDHVGACGSLGVMVPFLAK